MERSKVYFLAEVIPSLKGIERVFKALNTNLKGDIVAIKMHMGEYDNHTHVKPLYVKKIVELVKEAGGEPFVTDTTTIYGPHRDTGLGYHKVASAHGFSPDFLGCPVIIADGLRGEDGVVIAKGEDMDTEIEGIEVARSIYESDALIAISHATGHGGAGFGGAIKNVGMGCVTKKGKELQHAVSKPLFDKEKCVECKRCVERCLYGAIREDFEIEEEKCTGCGLCIAVCKEGARYISREQKERLQRRIAEAACLVLSKFKKEKTFFLNFLTDITAFCDCAKSSDFICPNIGVLASADIVAIDKCSVDMIKGEVGDVFIKNYDVDPVVQIERAHELKMGNKEYEIEKI
ncbi:MAG: DUF362 domain-containing protein [Candidatus Methanospirareceae archaeon]